MAAIKYTRTCPICGRIFTSTNSRKVYCTSQCQALHSALVKRESSNRRTVSGICIDCGHRWTKNIRTHDNARCEYCARSHAVHKRYAILHNHRTQRTACSSHRNYEWICLNCGKKFHTTTKRPRKYCGASCSREHFLSCQRTCETCRVCGVAVTKGRWYCDRCREELRKKRRSIYKRKRRAVIKGSLDNEDIDVVKVYDRDAWICGICGRPVDPHKHYPDPLSVSLDHRKPLSKGGTHTYDNVQCSHLECNIRKKDSLAFSSTGRALKS